MDQISPPMRILLAVAVVFLAAYMLVLRPGGEAVAPAPATVPAAEAGGAEAGTSLGKAVEGAREAAGATESAAQARSGETAPSTNQSSAAPVKPAPAEPAEKPADAALAKLPQWLQASIDKKVVALLFTNGESADDRRTSRALQRAYDGDGAVVTRVVNVRKISAYQAVAEGVDVSQSPTLMVIDRKRSAQALPGYSSLTTINQAIIDGLLATENPVEKVPFLKTAQREGRQISTRAIVGVTEGTTAAGAEKNVNATIDVMDASLGTLRNAPAPKAYRDVKAQVIRYLESEIAAHRQYLGAIGNGTIDLVAIGRATLANDKLMRQTLLELNAVGVNSFN